MPVPVDPALIAELFDRHAAALTLYASQWTAAADDCVQEALVELAGQLVAPENPPAWLYRVVRNRALNAARASRRRTANEQAAAQARGSMRPDASSPAAEVELNDLLATLELQAREIVVLRIWGQLAWREIAEVIGGSTSSAQRHYVAALQQLRQHWGRQSCPTN